ncbi:hypothetical protein, partial [Tabrizicola sp.]|uniref:hypothetical protein n=1 Tax=Tabrizicola sp. TaxID=2005166 RepID=UPI00286B388A
MMPVETKGSKIIQVEKVATATWKLAAMVVLIAGASFSAGAAAFGYLTADFVRVTDKIQLYSNDQNNTKFVLDIEDLSTGSNQPKSVFASPGSDHAFKI